MAVVESMIVAEEMAGAEGEEVITIEAVGVVTAAGMIMKTLNTVIA